MDTAKLKIPTLTFERNQVLGDVGKATFRIDAISAVTDGKKTGEWHYATVFVGKDVSFVRVPATGFSAATQFEMATQEHAVNEMLVSENERLSKMASKLKAEVDDLTEEVKARETELDQMKARA